MTTLLTEKEVLGILAEWSRTDHLRLHCGEMTAQELRTVKAVLNGIACEIRGIK